MKSVRLSFCFLSVYLAFCSVFGAGGPALAGDVPVPRASAVPGAVSPRGSVPAIRDLVKPAVLKKVIEDKEILSSAQLSDEDAQGKRTYSLHSSMRVGASLKRTYETLTNYQLYPKMISYIEKADFNPRTQVLSLVGGIFKYQVVSSVLFQERAPNPADPGGRAVDFRIIAGHFAGLTGQILFESLGERGTLVHFRGEQIGSQWPPKWIIERGAEIVFGFTAKRMRSYTESSKEQ